ncbi:methyl-accepting chemotaxis protein [Vibrio sp. TBV020]|uniref:methyl-accepting chemotaxis protein n=1 Tax=Vibrio sp. TBV020 TaxID=3137398 RepID=UPI0038CD8990
MLTFKRKLLISKLSLLVVSLATLAYFQYSFLYTEREKEIHNTIESVLLGVETTIDSEISGWRNIALSTTQTIENQLDANFIYQLIRQPKIKELFASAGVGFESNGGIVVNVDGWTPPTNWDSRDRPWYQFAKQKRELIITEPYIDVNTNQQMVSISAPIDIAGELKGVSFFDVSLSVLSDKVNKISPLNAGYLFLMTQDGRIISHPNSANNGRPISEVYPSLKVGESEQRMKLNGEQQIVQQLPVMSNEWIIASVLNEEQVYQSLDEMRDQTLIYLVAVSLIAITVLGFTVSKLLKPLGQMTNGINSLSSSGSKKDLTYRLDTKVDKEFSHIAGAFNSFVGMLQENIQSSKSLSNELDWAADTAVSNSEKSEVAILQQQQEVEQLVTALHEMSSTAQEMARSTQNAAQAANQAFEASGVGVATARKSSSIILELSEVVEQSGQDVNQLNISAESIKSLLHVISDISDQTNLLALNAAIEAARAGESGRGFAVVADEVRQLAKRTQDATTDITGILDELENHTEKVARSMSESIKQATTAIESISEVEYKLTSISGEVQSINDMNVQIATAAEEQSIVAEEISTNATNIRELSSQVTELVSDTRTGVQKLKLSNDRNSSLETFIV